MSVLRFLAFLVLMTAGLVRLCAQTTGATNPPAASKAPTPDSVTATLPPRAVRPSLMIKKGGKELEWRTSYSYSSRNSVFIDGVAVFPILVIGEIGVERIRRNSLTTSLAGRYGIADNVLVEVKVPFRYESDRSSVPEVTPPQENTVTSSGLGDVEGSLFFQFPRKQEDQIRWVLSLSAKSSTGDDPFEINTHEEAPLGSGFWNSRIGITGVKIVDPVAVYWNAGYTRNWERQNVPITITDMETGETSTIFVDIEPASLIEVGGGFAYAINSRLSVNTGVSISFSGASRSNGEKVANSAFTAASLRLGIVWLTDNRQPVDLGLSIGLTDDSPDFSLEFRKSFK